MSRKSANAPYKKPLGRSIAIGCVAFTTTLCLALSILNYFNLKNTMYARYQSYITDILVYARNHIDNEDMKKCMETNTESEKYKETLLFMDRIMNDFSIHYLYCIKPLSRNDTQNVLCIFSAEDDYNRYEDTEGNLFLGWISDDEYDAETASMLFDIMEQDKIVFFVEKTEWSTDYTGAVALRGDDGKAYAILAVDVDITTLASELQSQVVVNTAVILVLGAIYTCLFLLWAKANITLPVRMLEKGVVDYACRSHGQRNVEALKFEAPDINTDNEVESLSKAILQMTEDMQEYVSEILSAEEKTRTMKEFADAMSELAVKDALTGVLNKTAFYNEMAMLDEEILADRDVSFGVVMIDMNYLKRINDTFGHERGDEALQRLSQVICDVFAHSPVFRIGGDEFVVILQGDDYNKADALKESFIAKTAKEYSPHEPWKHVSAAVGIALYDTDQETADVMNRADAAMYEMKRMMKAEREESDDL